MKKNDLKEYESYQLSTKTKKVNDYHSPFTLYCTI